MIFNIIYSNEDLQELDDANKENVIMIDDENDVGIAGLEGTLYLCINYFFLKINLTVIFSDIN